MTGEAGRAGRPCSEEDAPATPLAHFLVLGAQRAGTTWLDGLLRTHPRLWLPVRRKEPHYFDLHYERGPSWYARFFDGAPQGALRGEVTPRYLYDPAACERIARDLPDARLVAVLRDPVDRAYSQYALTVRDEDYRAGFRTFLAERPDALERGLYHAQLRRYAARFPAERLLVLVLEEATRDVPGTVERLARFLGVSAAGFAPERAAGARNAGRRVRFARSYAAARRLGEWLRERDVDLPVELARRLGVARLFGSRGPLPPLAEELRRELEPRFAADCRRLREDFGLELGRWPTARAAAGEGGRPG